MKTASVSESSTTCFIAWTASGAMAMHTAVVNDPAAARMSSFSTLAMARFLETSKAMRRQAIKAIKGQVHFL